MSLSVELQVEREEALREWARGFRASIPEERLQTLASRGAMRTARGAVVSVRNRFYNICVALQEGRIADAQGLIPGDSGLALKVEADGTFRMPVMQAILRWCTLGGPETGMTHTGRYFDPALDFSATLLSETLHWLTMGPRDDGTRAHISLSSLTQRHIDSLQRVAAGQWITRFQGPKAAETIIERGKKSPKWAQRRALAGATHLLTTQAKAAMDATYGDTRSRIPIQVLDPRPGATGMRRLEFRGKPAEADWLLLESTTAGAAPLRTMTGPQRHAAWAVIVQLLMAAIQVECGLFEIYREQEPMKAARRSGLKHKGRRFMRQVAYVRLSGAVVEDMELALAHWVQAAAPLEPMWCEPTIGQGWGYCSMRLPDVSDGASALNAPRITCPETGLIVPATTRVDGSDQWWEAGWLAQTAWQNPYRSGRLGPIRELVGQMAASPGEIEPAKALRYHSTLDVATRCGSDHDIYLPIMMDFRGRTYYRPPYLSPQGGDLQKGLLSFARGGKSAYDLTNPLEAAMVLSHVRGIIGGPMEKAPIADFGGPVERLLDEAATHLAENRERAEERFQGLVMDLRDPHQGYQVDGTCNGLQHLSAMVLDPLGGAAVNLVPSGDPSREGPQDIYREVAQKAEAILRRDHAHEAWASRLLHGGARVGDRKVTKSAVMVIPYGATRTTVVENVIDSIRTGQAHLLRAEVWQQCRRWDGQQWVPDEEAIAGNYMAFSDRPMGIHPLLRKDCERYAEVVYRVIWADVMPQVAALVSALRAFAKAAGDNVIQWQTRPEGGFWVSQGRTVAKAHSTTPNGVYLEGMSRTLSLYGARQVAGWDPEAPDRGYHVKGLMPNFVHSHDADHMHRVAGMMRRMGHPMGSIHDCFQTDAGGLGGLAWATRATFVEKYRGPGLNREHPLMQRVRWLPVETSKGRRGEFREWATWYEALGEVAPEHPIPATGTLDIHGVLDSFYFFC